MSIDREESLFLTVSEDHRSRKYPQYIRLMSQPYREAGGMIGAYEGVILGGADKLLGLEELNLWLRRHRYAAYDMHTLLPIAHLCLEYAVRRRLSAQRPGIPAMAEQAARELLDQVPFAAVRGNRPGVPTKPDPTGLYALMAELGADPSTTLFVGDSDVDILTGHNAQLPAMGALWGFRGRAELTAAGADALAEVPEDILRYVQERNK